MLPLSHSRIYQINLTAGSEGVRDPVDWASCWKEPREEADALLNAIFVLNWKTGVRLFIQ